MFNLNDAKPGQPGADRGCEAANVVDFPRQHRTLSERIGDIARHLFGRENPNHSTADDLRFGTNGSISVKLSTGGYYNHETKRGGGVRELLEFEEGIKRGQDQAGWLQRELGIETAVPLARRTIAATYDYRDASGALLFQVCRFQPKDFRQRQPDPAKQGGWSWKVKGVPQVLYRLPELLAADPSQPVILVEGEKDADGVAALGVCATTNPGGSKKWRDSYSDALAGRHVVLLPDNDVAGREHAELAAARIAPRAASVRIVELPGLQPKGDASDWIMAGGTREQLLELAAAAPVFVAPSPSNNEAADKTAPLDGSEDQMADAFSREHADDLRYTKGMDWLRWDGQRWEIDQTHLVFDLARIVARRFSRDMNEPQLGSAKTIYAIERLAHADRRHARAVANWDQDIWLLNTPRGTVDLRTGELREHRPSDNITKITNASPDPNSACLLWHEFLDRATNNDTELKGFLQRSGGASLTGSTRDHAVFVHHGEGRNGKSLYIKILDYVLGEFARTAAAETFVASPYEHHTTDLAFLRGARLVSAQEIEEGKQWDLEKLKRLTGGDKITARLMRQDFISFTPECSIQIACNHLPGISTLDDAIKDRLNVVPWLVYIPPEDRDPELFEKLKLESDAILQWFVDGCLDWQEHGLAAPEAVTKATADYIGEEDSFGQWQSERCAFDGIYSDDMLTMYGDYLEWCLAQRVSALRRKQWRTEMLKRNAGNGVYQDQHPVTRRAILRRVALIPRS